MRLPELEILKSAGMRFVAEDALLVEFGEKLDDELHQKVLRLDSALKQSTISAYIETLPTFRSLMIKFDVFALSQETLLNTLSTLKATNLTTAGKTWQVPVCFESDCAQDLAEVSDLLDLSESTIINMLLQTPLKLYMYGFAPGFAYLGGLDKGLNIPRRATPRAPMPEGALMIAGGLACLSSVSMPTGWYVLGQTPVSMFSLLSETLVPFAVGDELQLYEINFDEFRQFPAMPGNAGAEQNTG
jgi:KipI family sensor histidine kinase inhibitor